MIDIDVDNLSPGEISSLLKLLEDPAWRKKVEGKRKGKGEKKGKKKPAEGGTVPLAQPSFKPVAQIHLIVRQKCRACSGEVAYIGGQFTRFRSEKARATVDRQELILGLPSLVEEYQMQVERCPNCLQIEEVGAVGAVQLTLW